MLKTLFSLFVGFGWHIMNVLRFKPSLAYFGDTRFNLIFVSAVFFLMGIFRHSLHPSFGQAGVIVSFVVILVTLSFMYVLFGAIFLRQNKSKVLFMGMLMCSIGVDVIGLVVNLLGGSQTIGTVLTFYEIALYFVVYKSYSKLPESMKKSGYRPGPKTRGSAA